MNSYIPIYDILAYNFDINDKLSLDLFKGVKSLPETMMNKLLDEIKKEEAGVTAAEVE